MATSPTAASPSFHQVRSRLGGLEELAIRRARIDPNTFLTLCFTDATGQPLQQATVHRELQEFLTRHRKALIELPRDHGKSVQVCGRIVWELGRDPSLRVKLVCATDQLAEDRSRFLRSAIESPMVRRVFPHLRAKAPWSVNEFTVVRPGEVIGASVSAVGLGTGSTGARADLLVCDDVVDVRSLHSARERQRVKDYFSNNLLNLLEPDGRFWGLFTPWHRDDLNASLKANESYALFRRAVGPNLEPVWPEKWSTAKLLERRAEIGSASFARGYCLTPIDSSELLIRPEWIKTWETELARSQFERVVLAVDPAVSEKPSADATALVVLGKFQNEVRCLEAIARRVALPELVDWLSQTETRWQPDAIVFESNAAFGAMKDLLVRQERFGPRVKGLTNVRNKYVRLAAFSVSVENGCFRLSQDGTQKALWEEMTLYPHGAHDDLLDAAATATEWLLSHREPRVW